MSKGKKETPDVSPAGEQSGGKAKPEHEIEPETRPEQREKGTDSDDGRVAEGQPAGEAASDLEARYTQLSDQYVRLVADFDNFRRRTRENEGAVREQAAANLVKDLLPVIDNLQLALAKADTAADEGFAQGVQLIEQQLTTVLTNHGVQPIETAGRPFDPHTMEAVAQLPGQGHAEPGHVMEELRRGYVLHDKVLRPAQVVVAQAE